MASSKRSNGRSKDLSQRMFCGGVIAGETAVLPSSLETYRPASVMLQNEDIRGNILV